MEITNTNRKPTDVHVHANTKPLSSSLVGQDQGKGKGSKGQTQRHEATQNYSVKARKRKRTETQHNVGRRPNDDAHGVGGQQATRTRAATAVMSPSRLSESESLSDSDGHRRRRPTTVANKWGTFSNRRPVNNPLRAVRTPLSSTLSSRSRLSLSSESSPELLRHAGLLSPSRASAQADVHAANSRNDDALLPSPSLFDMLDNSENAKPAVTTAVRTYSKKTKKQRTVMGSAATPGPRPSIGEQILKDVSSGRVVPVSLPSTKALGIRSSSLSHPSPGTTSTGVQCDDDKDKDDDDDDYEEEENASDDQDDGSNKGSGLVRNDQSGDNSNAPRGQSKSSDFLQAFYMSQRQLWKEVDEISLEEELVG